MSQRTTSRDDTTRGHHQYENHERTNGRHRDSTSNSEILVRMRATRYSQDHQADDSKRERTCILRRAGRHHALPPTRSSDQDLAILGAPDATPSTRPHIPFGHWCPNATRSTGLHRDPPATKTSPFAGIFRNGASRTRTGDLLGAIQEVIFAYLARFPCICAGCRLSDDRRKPADLGSIRLGLGPRRAPMDPNTEADLVRQLHRPSRLCDTRQGVG
jgi:hypothetical protein